MEALRNLLKTNIEIEGLLRVLNAHESPEANEVLKEKYNQFACQINEYFDNAVFEVAYNTDDELSVSADDDKNDEPRAFDTTTADEAETTDNISDTAPAISSETTDNKELIIEVVANDADPIPAEIIELDQQDEPQTPEAEADDVVSPEANDKIEETKAEDIENSDANDKIEETKAEDDENNDNNDKEAESEDVIERYINENFDETTETVLMLENEFMNLSTLPTNDSDNKEGDTIMPKLHDVADLASTQPHAYTPAEAQEQTSAPTDKTPTDKTTDSYATAFDNKPVEEEQPTFKNAQDPQDKADATVDDLSKNSADTKLKAEKSDEIEFVEVDESTDEFFDDSQPDEYKLEPVDASAADTTANTAPKTQQPARAKSPLEIYQEELANIERATKSKLDEEDQVYRVADMINRRESSDLSKAFTLNDKFRYISQLFDNDRDYFDEVINQLSRLDNLHEAYDYIFCDLGWDENNKDVKDFLKVIMNHFGE